VKAKKEKAAMLFDRFVAERVPKFNRYMTEGLVYHRLKNAVKYIDNYIRYTVNSKTNTHLKYLGYKELTPQEEIKFIFNKSGKVNYDLAENDYYLVNFMFQYGSNDQIKNCYFYIPYARRGNIIYLSGNRFLLMPVLADKVISIGEKIIFINIATAKHSFSRQMHVVMVNDEFKTAPIIITELYKNQVKKKEDTTKAHSTVMHYLLANYGYEETMKRVLGFVPKVSYDEPEENNVVVIRTCGTPPKGYIRPKHLYKPNNIKFIIPKEQYNEDVLYAIGNIFYVIDNFPDSITIANMNSPIVWRKLLGEIIHSGEYTTDYLFKKMNAHFSDLNSSLNPITKNKLKDIGIECETLMELLVVIFSNFNKWYIDTESRCLYNNKTYEVETYVLSPITYIITRMILELSKEELANGGKELDYKVFNNIFKLEYYYRIIFNLKKDNCRQFVSTTDYSGDHLYFKNTAMIAVQEPDFINIKNETVSNIERKKITASMATVGSILGLNKKDPTPVIRLNPYVNVDFETGNIYPPVGLEHIVNETDKLLANIVEDDNIEDNIDYKELESMANEDNDLDDSEDLEVDAESDDVE